MSIIFGFATIGIIFLGSAVFVIRFANRLTAPIVSLTRASKELAGGNMNFTVAESKHATDEVGTLARSFLTMAVKLRDKIAQQDSQNKTMSEKNDELGLLNRLMVDRELKMIELKKENALLKEQQSKIS